MSIKVNKMAVLLCGDLRSWKRAAPYIFEFVETLADNIDYYFATWNTTRDHWWPEEKSIRSIRIVTPEDITEPFAGRNLVGYKLVDQSVLPRRDITIHYQSYLAKVANTLKRRYEFDNNFIYDQVVEMRPDIYIPRLHMDELVPVCKDFEYLIGPPYDNEAMSFPQIGDFYSRANSFTNDVLANRQYYKKEIEVGKLQIRYKHWPNNMNNHWVLLDYLQNRRLYQIAPRPYTRINPLKESENFFIIRPNFPDGDLHQYSRDQLIEFGTEWINYQWQ